MIRFSFIHAILLLLTAYIASERGRRWWAWALLGLFLPIVSLILVLLLPAKKPESLPRPAVARHPGRPCLVCGREAPLDALYCPYCRSELNRPR